MTSKADSKKYDLEERTAKFGENIIKFCQKIPKGPITNPLITRLVKCGTSVGANYSEADDAESKQDFKYKIGIYLLAPRSLGEAGEIRTIRLIGNLTG